MPLRPTVWELDGFCQRFATSAIDPVRPFDRATAPTHWIFADLDEWNAVMEASVRDTVPKPRRRATPSMSIFDQPEPGPASADATPVGEERLVRLPEVMRRLACRDRRYTGRWMRVGSLAIYRCPTT